MFSSHTLDNAWSPKTHDWNSSMNLHLWHSVTQELIKLKVTTCPTVPFLMSLQEEDPKRSGDQSIDRLASCEPNDRSASHPCSQCTSMYIHAPSLPLFTAARASRPASSEETPTNCSSWNTNPRKCLEKLWLEELRQKLQKIYENLWK